MNSHNQTRLDDRTAGGISPSRPPLTPHNESLYSKYSSQHSQALATHPSCEGDSWRSLAGAMLLPSSELSTSQSLNHEFIPGEDPLRPSCKPALSTNTFCIPVTDSSIDTATDEPCLESMLPELTTSTQAARTPPRPNTPSPGLFPKRSLSPPAVDHGHSCSALMHLKEFWNARYDNYARAELDSGSKDTYGDISGFSRNEEKEASCINVASETTSWTTSPAPMSQIDRQNPANIQAPIFPRVGDLSSLRDRKCAIVDRAFAGLPLCTIGKILFLHDMLERSRSPPLPLPSSCSLSPLEPLSPNPRTRAPSPSLQDDIRKQLMLSGTEIGKTLHFLPEQVGLVLDHDAECFVDVALSSGSSSVGTDDDQTLVSSSPVDAELYSSDLSLPQHSSTPVELHASSLKAQLSKLAISTDAADTEEEPTISKTLPEIREWEVNWFARWKILINHAANPTSKLSPVLMTFSPPLSLSIDTADLLAVLEEPKISLVTSRPHSPRFIIGSSSSEEDLDWAWDHRDWDPSDYKPSFSEEDVGGSSPPSPDGDESDEDEDYGVQLTYPAYRLSAESLSREFLGLNIPRPVSRLS